MQSEISLMRILQAIYLRCGGESRRTKLFQNFSQEIQSDLRRAITLAENELPVVAYFASKEHWVLISTRKTYLCQCGELLYVANTEIVEATVHFPSLGKPHRPELTEILLTTKSGMKHILHLEGGKPYSGIWNVLLHFRAINERAR